MESQHPSYHSTSFCSSVQSLIKQFFYLSFWKNKSVYGVSQAGRKQQQIKLQLPWKGVYLHNCNLVSYILVKFTNTFFWCHLCCLIPPTVFSRLCHKHVWTRPVDPPHRFNSFLMPQWWSHHHRLNTWSEPNADNVGKGFGPRLVFSKLWFYISLILNKVFFLLEQNQLHFSFLLSWSLPPINWIWFNSIQFNLCKAKSQHTLSQGASQGKVMTLEKRDVVVFYTSTRFVGERFEWSRYEELISELSRCW